MRNPTMDGARVKAAILSEKIIQPFLGATTWH